MIFKHSKKFFCIFFISLFLIFNIYSIIVGGTTIGVYNNTTSHFYPLSKSTNMNTYTLDDNSSISFNLSSTPILVTINHKSEQFTFLANVNKVDSSQYSIELSTTEYNDIFRGTFDVNQDRQITSIPNKDMIIFSSSGSSQLSVDDSSLTNNGFELTFYVLSSMIIEKTTTKISAHWNLIVIGIVIQLLGLCIIIFNEKFIQLGIWLEGFVYENAEQLQPTSFLIFISYLIGVILFVIGIVCVSRIFF